jgi:hypothetical protein
MCFTFKLDNTSFAKTPSTVSLSFFSVLCVLLSPCAELSFRILLSLFVCDGESYVLGGLSLDRCALR